MPPRGALPPGAALFEPLPSDVLPPETTVFDGRPSDAELFGLPPSAEPPSTTAVFAGQPPPTAPPDAPPPDMPLGDMSRWDDGRPSLREPPSDSPRDRSSGPLPLPARLAGAVTDRIPPSLKAFRVGVDGRVVAAVAVLAVLALVFVGVSWWQKRPQPVAVPPADMVAASGTPSLGGTPSRPRAVSADPSGDAPAPTAPGPISVHVVGRVASPGVLVLPAGARVDDVLKAAGGVLPGTDLTVLNLARVVGDGEQIPVGVPGATEVPGVPGGSGASAAKSAQSVVDLNSATAEQLETLPGIGPVTARSILEWRQENGRFTSIDQLREIRGIGESRFADLRAKVRV